MPVSLLLFEFIFSIDIYYDRVPSLTILGDHLLFLVFIKFQLYK